MGLQLCGPSRPLSSKVAQIFRSVYAQDSAIAIKVLGKDGITVRVCNIAVSFHGISGICQGGEIFLSQMCTMGGPIHYPRNISGKPRGFQGRKVRRTRQEIFSAAGEETT